MLTVNIELTEATMTEAKPTRLFHCSFCGKAQTEVKLIIQGPCVAICDECITLCTRIAQDTPTTPLNQIRTPDKTPTEQLLLTLGGYNKTSEAADAAMQDLVDLLREREVSWATIGEAMGVTRQAAWKRFG
jgi:ATP-dependent Clp protease ATP-binding subunit ClpX